MSNLNEQLKNNLFRDIAEFNSNPNYAGIRELYRHHYDTIVSYIEKFGHKLSVEDIARLDNSMSDKVIENIQLLQEINKAISKGQLKKSDIK
jgi:dimeric dUTPase (all-alpha-NTP-PPase superfamily)